MYTASVSKGARRRSLTLLIACLSAFAAFTAIATAQASAAPVQGSGSWYVNGAKLEGGSVPVKCQIPAGQTFKLTASFLGEPFEVTATGVECLESRISQEGSLSVASGRLRLVGTKMTKPAGCEVPPTVTFSALRWDVWSEGEVLYSRIRPASGTTFFNLPVYGCGLEMTAPFTGTIFGRFQLPEAQEALQQPLAFSSAINSAAGGAFKFAGSSAALTGTLDLETISGQPFSWRAL